jgi:hypothetical protein
MYVHFIAALLLATMAAASSQENSNLRGKKHNATDVSTDCTFDYRSGDAPTTDGWTNCSFEALFGPPPKMGPITLGDREFKSSGNWTKTMARDYWCEWWYYYSWYGDYYEWWYEWVCYDWYYRTFEPPFEDSSSGGRAFASASSNTNTNKCEECSKNSNIMTVTGERMHAESSPGQCEEACVTAATKGHWEVAGWKCGPCPD